MRVDGLDLRGQIEMDILGKELLLEFAQVCVKMQNRIKELDLDQHQLLSDLLRYGKFHNLPIISVLFELMRLGREHSYSDSSSRRSTGPSSMSAKERKLSNAWWR